MKKIVEIFDSALLYVVSYPKTLFDLIFFPKKVIGKEMPETVCPPGISFAISLLIAFFAKRLLDTILVPNVDWIRVPSTSFVVGVIVFTAVVLSIQWTAIAIIFRRRKIQDDPVSAMQALAIR